MAERMTFPMYAIHRQQTQALWQAVQSLLDERGVMVAGDPPAADPGDLLAHWRQPTLLLSQNLWLPAGDPIAGGADGGLLPLRCARLRRAPLSQPAGGPRSG
ncbi:putative ABC phosphate/phosphonate transport system periplasmic ligand-binding component [Klebsiella pneumoniae]|uniref:Putative ABC phosphate/phosphonate transport system periplasmic ligand-binding component n=1 Tax=Klebsiella pneumoniae TaxID=573 RepID=A0A2X1QQG4_KLEPN|nr:putative ABC phosphate/phosphonate transport system periplasmic ligand-binding component [Klebsiella pneumoniae]